MIRALAHWLARAAIRRFPPACAALGEGMLAELDQTRSTGEALCWALGCCWTAAQQRLRRTPVLLALGQGVVVVLILLASASLISSGLDDFGLMGNPTMQAFALHPPTAFIAASIKFWPTSVWLRAAPNVALGIALLPLAAAILIGRWRGLLSALALLAATVLTCAGINLYLTWAGGAFAPGYPPFVPFYYEHQHLWVLERVAAFLILPALLLQASRTWKLRFSLSRRGVEPPVSEG